MASLKCLSARFVIDMVGGEGDSGEVVRASLKCLSARFVIDIDEKGSRIEV